MFFPLIFLLFTIIGSNPSINNIQKRDIMSIFKTSKSVRPKSISRHHHHQRLVRPQLHHVQYYPKRRSSYTTKTKSFSVIASIRKSILNCKRRFIKFFSKFARTKSHHQHQVYRILDRKETFIETYLGDQFKLPFQKSVPQPFQVPELQENHDQFLPPLVWNKKRTIVLDMDETLVHSTLDLPPSTYDFMIEPTIQGITMNFYVLKRPGVVEFLKTLSKNYEVVLFTAGLEPYASLVLDLLDPKGLMISHRLYRDSCKQLEGGRYVKDLSKLGRDLGNVVIVDDNPKSYSLQPENAIPIKRFEDDIEDRELEKLMVFFQKYCDGFGDMRDAVKLYNNLSNF